MVQPLLFQGGTTPELVRSQALVSVGFTDRLILDTPVNSGKGRRRAISYPITSRLPAPQVSTAEYWSKTRLYWGCYRLVGCCRPLQASRPTLFQRPMGSFAWLASSSISALLTSPIHTSVLCRSSRLSQAIYHPPCHSQQMAPRDFLRYSPV